MAKSFSKEKQHTHVDQQAAYVSYIIDFILNIFIHEKKEKKNNNWTRTFPRNRYAFWKYNKTHVFDVVDWHVCRINISHDILSTVNFMPM